MKRFFQAGAGAVLFASSFAALALPAAAQTCNQGGTQVSTCAYNSTQATCTAPVTGGGQNCTLISAAHRYTSSGNNCVVDPRSCATNQRFNCASAQCECNTALFPCGGCTVATSTVGAACGSPTGGTYTNQCGACGCPGGAAPVGGVCVNNVILSPASVAQTGYIAVSRANATGIPLIAGATYYDSTLNKFQCYIGGGAAGWKDCGGDQWITNAMNIYMNPALTGNVGIGDTTPDYSLDIEKSQNAATMITVANPNAGTAVLAGISVGQSDSGSNSGYLAHTGTGVTPNGVVVPDRTLLVGGDTQGLGFVTSNATAPIVFGTTASYSERMRLTYDGKLGIGTTAPGDTLAVNGGIQTASLASYDLTTAGTNSINVGGSTGYDQWINFRLGGNAPRQRAGVVFSRYNTNHFFMYADTTSTGRMRIDYSSTNEANPDVDNASNLLTLTGSGNLSVGGNVAGGSLSTDGTATIGNTLTVTGGGDAALASGGYIVTGLTSGTNVAIDNNEIMARNNGVASTLYLNADGGVVETGEYIHIATNDGYIDIGPQSVNWAHIETDRPNFYFNTGITVDTGLIDSYDEDLLLRANSQTGITIDKDNGHVGMGAAPSNSYWLTVAGSMQLSSQLFVTDSVFAPDIYASSNLRVGSAPADYVPMQVACSDDATAYDSYSGCLLVGSASGNNIIIDQNEIMARAWNSSFYTPSLDIATLNLNVGGTTSVDYLRASADQGDDEVAEFRNEDTGGNADGILIRVDATNPGSGNNLIVFQRTGGTTLDAIEGDGAYGARFTGTSAGTYSDRRLKTNIHEYHGSALEAISGFRPVTFNYVDGTNPGLTRVGFIAQEMLDKYPQAINFGDPLPNVPEDQLPILKFDYGELTPLLTRGIQELQAMVEADAARINSLESRIEELEKMLK